jgi:osmotically-inducible protein OsmY
MTQTLHTSDLELADAVRDELEWTPSIGSQGVVVSVLDGKVTLSGYVATYPELLLAAKAAQRVRGVTALVQAIVVRHGPDQVNDLDISAEAAEALQRAVDVPDSIRATADAGSITLSGEAQWQYEREAAARSVRHLKGVGAIHNRITIRPTATAAGLDALISAALVRSAQLRGRSICATTNTRGRVTLTGTVSSWAESKQAEQACWGAPGITEIDNQLRLQY